MDLKNKNGKKVNQNRMTTSKALRSNKGQIRHFFLQRGIK
jgi:hypothetical protein